MKNGKRRWKCFPTGSRRGPAGKASGWQDSLLSLYVTALWAMLHFLAHPLLMIQLCRENCTANGRTRAEIRAKNGEASPQQSDRETPFFRLTPISMSQSPKRIFESDAARVRRDAQRPYHFTTYYAFFCTCIFLLRKPRCAIPISKRRKNERSRISIKACYSLNVKKG